MMEQSEAYAESIRYYSGLSVDTVQWLGSGQNNDILLINSTYVFRFPKYDEGIERLKDEIDFLNRIAAHTTLQVPRPFYWNYRPDGIGRAFVCYMKIEGEPLEAELMGSIEDERHLRRLADQLGLFLKSLHGVTFPESGTGYTGYSDWSDLYERVQSKLYTYMNPEAKSRIDRHFSGYLGERSNFEIIPVPVHGDFGTSNILYDARGRRIGGIIDFGSAGIGDPAVDYAALRASYGERFFRFVLDAYPEVADMMARIDFYRGTFALQEALFGLEHNDREAFRNGIESYL